MNEVKKGIRPIAFYGMSNTSGISIYKIDHAEETISFQFVTDEKVIDDRTSKIEYITTLNNEDQEYETYVGFYYDDMFIPLNECIKVNHYGKI